MVSLMPKRTIVRLTQNTILIFLLNFVVRASNSIIFILLARFRNENEAGIFILAISYSLILESISLWGLDQLLVRDVAQNKASMYNRFPIYVGLRLILSLIGIVFFAVIIIFGGYTIDLRKILLIIL